MNIVPTGNPWVVSKEDEATVVLATDAMKVKIHGGFRQRERKLFLLLVHAVWSDLETKKFHTLEVSKISRIFTEITGSKNQQWIWEYFKNIANVKVTYHSKRLEGVLRLFSWAEIDKEKDTITFEFPHKLIEVLTSPQSWGRLKTHFAIGLGGKYSVSLYQLLESKINLQVIQTKGYFEISLEELKDWLGLGGEYKKWIHFRDRVLNPAIDEINSNPITSTFTVKTENIAGEKRNKITAIRFYLTKTSSRLVQEKKMKVLKQARQTTRESETIPPFRSTVIYEKAQKIGRGLDIYQLEAEWRKSVEAANIKINNPEAHFLGFVKKRALAL